MFRDRDPGIWVGRRQTRDAIVRCGAFIRCGCCVNRGSAGPRKESLHQRRSRANVAKGTSGVEWPAAAPASASAAPQVRRAVREVRAAHVASAPASAEQNPLWYAAQLDSLYAELDSLSSREASLREFRDTGSAPGVTIGLQFGAPCEGITTDNAIQQLALRRQEILQQISDLQDTAQQNGVSPAVFQDPSEILQSTQKPLSPGQERAVLLERQSDLVGKLDGVQNQLADMSSEAAAQGITLLPVTPDWGGNLTTNRIQSLDERAQELQNALSENEAAARQAGLASNALP